MWDKERISQWECRIMTQETAEGIYVMASTPDHRRPNSLVYQTYGPFHRQIDERRLAAFNYYQEFFRWQVKEDNSLPTPSIPALLLSENPEQYYVPARLDLYRQQDFYLQYANVVELDAAPLPPTTWAEVPTSVGTYTEAAWRGLEIRARDYYGRSLLEDVNEAIERNTIVPPPTGFTAAIYDNPWAALPEDDDD